MGRKRRIFCEFLIIAGIITNGCEGIYDKRETSVRIIIEETGYLTKAIDPDENRISDISILVFDENGDAEQCVWITEDGSQAEIRLVRGKRYSFHACVNFGYQVYADRIEELDEIIFHMAYPDEYRNGIPMAGERDLILTDEDIPVRIPVRRLMARISLQMDRSALSEDVSMYVRSVEIGNCPKTTSVFKENRIKDKDKHFRVGFRRDGYETDMLNEIGEDGRSGIVSLYMLENMQGTMIPGISCDEEKTFDEDDPRRDLCSYVEMELEYMSSTHYSKEKSLIYRFYLGDGLNNLDIERNCHYHITIRPEDDGLKGSGWRVDKSGIQDIEPVSFSSYPSNYIRGDIGDQIHIWCEFTPSSAPFDVGESYMIDDKAEGIYDYVIDEDGHGAVLTLTGPGRGLIYMEAGPPVNEAALFVIEVNL